jgi:phosphonoacetaldehyde hydrolase
MQPMPSASTVDAVVFDWAGTLVDFGSLAPVSPFCRVFADEGVEISHAEARGPMGLAKMDHIAALLSARRIAEAWTKAHGKPPIDDDIGRLYAAFVRHQLAAIRDSAVPIDGAIGVVNHLRADGVRVGSCTGYNRDMLVALRAAAAERGLVVDVAVSSDDVPNGRPAPDLSLRALELLGIDAPRSAIKVDDTTPGIEEGRAAGMWTVGVCVSGNEVGLPARDWNALPRTEQSRLREAAAARLGNAGAHYVVDTVADLPRCVAAIRHRLASAEAP